MDSSITFRPQDGPQMQFMQSHADVVIYGGSAGGGKTAALLMECFRGLHRKQYHAAIFRREHSQIDAPGGLLDTSEIFFNAVGGVFNQNSYRWKFGKHIDVSLRGMQYERDKLKFHGAELDYIGFDELTNFVESQFWYLFSRARSKSGEITPYIRATCNPEPGWVANLIDWWIDDDGFAIAERSGVIRYFIRQNDKMIWFDTESEGKKYIIENNLQNECDVSSFTFIRAQLEDNQILMQRDPSYIKKLYALPEIDKQRLLYGNWKIKNTGKLFKASDFKNFSGLKPADTERVIITVDTAQETKTANDYTVMQVWCRAHGRIYLLAQARGRWEFPQQVLMLVNLCLNYKPHFVTIERQANGSALIQSMRRHESISVPIRQIDRKKDKYTRGFECQEWVKGGYVYINPAADYYTDFIAEATGFAPENKDKSSMHDDQIDCMMDAIDHLLINYVSAKPKQSTNHSIHQGVSNGKFTAFKGA
jgi:predicted phage terminase large subunit-like protein